MTEEVVIKHIFWIGKEASFKEAKGWPKKRKEYAFSNNTHKKFKRKDNSPDSVVGVEMYSIFRNEWLANDPLLHYHVQWKRFCWMARSVCPVTSHRYYTKTGMWHAVVHTNSIVAVTLNSFNSFIRLPSTYLTCQVLLSCMGRDDDLNTSWKDFFHMLCRIGHEYVCVRAAVVVDIIIGMNWNWPIIISEVV